MILGRLPKDDDELWHVVRALWNVTIPRTPVCPDHVPPFTAFADAYFGRNSIDPDSEVNSIALWHGSRGLSGKSFMLAVLGLTKAVLLGADVNLLGGSFEQSKNIHTHMRSSWDAPNAPAYMLAQDGAMEVKLTNKAKIRPLTASQRTVRGPHPPFLLLDEIDEMDIEILDAALGQPLPQKNYLGQVIKPYTAMCSTWQNPEGCMVLGTPIATRRGEMPIEQVRPGDFVPTRDGWREVTASINTGYQPTVSVHLASGKAVTCTPWHPFWTAEGWVDASLLPVGAHVVAVIGGMTGTEGGGAGADALPATPALAGRLFGAGQRQVVPALAGGLLTAERPGTFIVDRGADGFQVPRVDAGAVPAQMVEVLIRGERADRLDPHPSVGQQDPLRQGPVGLVSIPARGEAQGPIDALVGVQVEDYAFADDQVVNVVHHGTVLPTWDLTVANTHEYCADGLLVHNTFTEVMRRCEERGIPRYTWCFRESANPVDGWLSLEAIEEKKHSISAEMWRVEFELGEPAIGNRAFDTEAVDNSFCLPMEPLAKKEAKDFEEYTFAEPERDGSYVATADWGKEQDYTVISVARIDRKPYQLVYFMRVNRRPYPVMVGWFNDAMRRYNASAEHDGTGLGNVINDYLDVNARSFTMTGEKRARLLSEYVSAIERGDWRFPKIRTAYLAHKYARVGDLYSSKQEYHLPDEVCAFALMQHMASRAVGPALPLVLKPDGTPTRLQKPFLPERRRDGDVVSQGEADEGRLILTV